MPIDGVGSSGGSTGLQLAVGALKKIKDTEEQTGKQAVRLIESANVASPQVRAARHPDSTISVLA